MSTHPTARLLVIGLGVLALSTLADTQGLERVLYVSALDATTRAPVTDLGVRDFRVTEDGVTREVLRVTPATTPMPVALLVDNQHAARLTIADLRTAVESFLRDIQGLGPIAVVSVAERPTIVQDYTTDPARLSAATKRLFAVPDAGATLLDAIVEVSRGIGKRESDRAAIVLVTTELTEFSNYHYSQVLEALKASGAMMSAVIYQNQQGPGLDDPAQNRAVVLDRGVNETGGWRETVLTSMSYRQALAKIGAALKNQYRVVYARPETLIPPERVTISSTRDNVSVSGHPARGQKDR
jgi:VWFA-related protein